MIELGRPEALLLLVVVAAMAIAILLLARWRRNARQRFAGPRPAMWSRSFGWHASLLLLAGATLLVVAAAQPRWGSFQVSRERSGVDLVIVFDVSQSMLAEDVAPSRFGLAQQEVTRLIETQRGSRIGLVFFAGTAIVRSPLTTDTQALVQLIERASREGQLTRAGSDIGAALDQAALILTAGEADGKAVVVVSDGEDHVGAAPSKLQALRDQGVAVYAAGIGTAAGSTLNERDPRTGLPRLKLDGGGLPVVTRLNETTLQALVVGGPGRYLHLDGVNNLDSLADDLATLSQTPLGADLERVPIERFQWFAGAALAVLVVAWLLPERIAISRPRFVPSLRPSPGIAMMLLALLFAGCGDSGDSLRDDNSVANELFEAGDYEGALAAYQQLLSQRPDVPELSYNVGNTLHRMEEFERAVAETQRALPPTDNELGAMTFYALGNHLYALDELEQAYNAYRSALILNPHDADSKHNLELTLLRLLQQPPPSQAAGDGTEPTPGPQGQPGQQPQSTPTPSGQPSPAGTPQPTSEDLRRSLQEALRGIDEELTFEQAVQILELLQEQQERQQPPGPAGSPGGPDY